MASCRSPAHQVSPGRQAQGPQCFSPGRSANRRRARLRRTPTAASRSKEPRGRLVSRDVVRAGLRTFGTAPTVQVGDRQVVKDLEFNLVRGGVITGRVAARARSSTNRFSDLRRGPVGTKAFRPRPLMGGEFRTDDRGVYRSSPVGRTLLVSVGGGLREAAAWQRTYYPDAVGTSDVTPVGRLARKSPTSTSASPPAKNLCHHRPRRRRRKQRRSRHSHRHDKLWRRRAFNPRQPNSNNSPSSSATDAATNAAGEFRIRGTDQRNYRGLRRATAQ